MAPVDENADVYTCSTVLTGHTRSISSLKWSYDGSLLASSSADGCIKVWHNNTNTCTMSDLHDSGVNDIAWSNTAQYIASASDDKNIGIWNVETAQPVRLMKGHTHNVMCVAFNASSTLLVSGM